MNFATAFVGANPTPLTLGAGLIFGGGYLIYKKWYQLQEELAPEEDDLSRDILRSAATKAGLQQGDVETGGHGLGNIVGPAVNKLKGESLKDTLLGKLTQNPVFREVEALYNMTKEIAGILQDEVTDFTAASPFATYYFLLDHDKKMNKNKLFRNPYVINEDPYLDVETMLETERDDGLYKVQPVGEEEQEELVETLLHYGQLATSAYRRDQAELVQDLEEIFKTDNQSTRIRLLHYDNESDVEEPANYLVVLEKREADAEDVREWTAVEVVLGIRGTQTFDDVLTDVNHSTETRGKVRAHEGMMQGAEFVMGVHKDILTKFEKAGAAITVVGHSLGAGTAALVAIGGRLNGTLPTIRCYAYACPALLDLESSLSCKDYVTTVIHGSDCIPRSSMYGMVRLQNEMEDYDFGESFQQDVKELKESITSEFKQEMEAWNRQNESMWDWVTEVGALVETLVKSTVADRIIAKVQEEETAMDVRRAMFQRRPPPKKGMLMTSKGEWVKASYVPGKVYHAFCPDVYLKTQALPGQDLKDTFVDADKDGKDDGRVQIVRVAAKRFIHVQLTWNMAKDHSAKHYLGTLEKYLDQMKE